MKIYYTNKLINSIQSQAFGAITMMHATTDQLEKAKHHSKALALFGTVKRLSKRISMEVK